MTWDKHWKRIRDVAAATAMVVAGLLLSVDTAKADGLPSVPKSVAGPILDAGPTAAAPFAGLYLGAGGGYGWTGLETTLFDCGEGWWAKCTNGTEDSRLAHGWRGDGRLGVDWQNGALVLGILGGYGYGESEYTDTTLKYGPVSITLTPTYYLGGRVGFAKGQTLWYFGGAWQHAEIAAQGPGPFARDIEGWKALGGVEMMLTPQISLALEGGHTWYEAVSNQVEDAPGVRYESRDAEVMLRLNWRPFGKQ